jgi:hypothetical protein
MPRMLKRAAALTLAAAALALAAAPSAGAEGSCPNEAIRDQQGSTLLPDCRAYEMVSPPEKNGGGVTADSGATAVADDGDAVAFESLASFAEPLGTGLENDYLAVRSAPAAPGSNGWATRNLMPAEESESPLKTIALVHTHYTNYSADLTRGILSNYGALNGEQSIAGAFNLYENRDLRSSPLDANFSAVTTCPACEAGSGPLGLSFNVFEPYFVPLVVGATPDLAHVAFESIQPLTPDGPSPLQECDLAEPEAPGKEWSRSSLCGTRAYEWDEGRLSLAGRVPVSPATLCDDAGTPACVPADLSIVGFGGGDSQLSALRPTHVDHPLTVDSAGNTRLLFTVPTNASGETSRQLGDPRNFNSTREGRLYMRVNAHETVQIDVPEHVSAPVYAPATFLAASADGRRVFFKTAEALTADAPAGDGEKLYMYDATKPPGSGENLTLINREQDPSVVDEGVQGVIGTSANGGYVYFVNTGQLIAGAPALGVEQGIFVWHEGDLRYVAPSIPSSHPGGKSDQITAPSAAPLEVQQSRVTPDGRHMLFIAYSGEGLGGYDNGHCPGSEWANEVNEPGPCREFYVYDAETGSSSCASCNPTGAPATRTPSDLVWQFGGAGGTHDEILDRAISDDGTRVFFTTAEALVTGASDRKHAYEWTAAGTHGCRSENAVTHGCTTLISPADATNDAYFVEASGTGRDVFFVTAQRLVGWDTDSAYDLYDAREGGGFPEPPSVAAPCGGGACQSAPQGLAPAATPASSSYIGLASRPASTPTTTPKPSRAALLKRALAACRAKRSHRPRRRCEALARRRYATHSLSARRAK